MHEKIKHFVCYEKASKIILFKNKVNVLEIIRT